MKNDNKVCLVCGGACREPSAKQECFECAHRKLPETPRARKSREAWEALRAWAAREKDRAREAWEFLEAKKREEAMDAYMAKEARNREEAWEAEDDQERLDRLPDKS
jgi:glycine/D-amino acid oxidase-like deaminating enzyme